MKIYNKNMPFLKTKLRIKKKYIVCYYKQLKKCKFHCKSKLNRKWHRQLLNI